MSRLVQPSRMVTIEHRAINRSGRAVVVPETVSVAGDGYVDRIAKYIPAEVTAAYLSLDRFLVPAPQTPQMRSVASRTADVAVTGPAVIPSPVGHEALAPYLPSIVFALAMIFTPLYIMQLARRAGPGTPWITHAVMASLALFVWAYTMKGSLFEESGYYNGTCAGVLLIIFSLASGLFAPTPLPQGQQQE